MKRLFGIFLAAAAIALCAAPSASQAFQPLNQRWIDGAQYSKVIPAVAASGTLTYITTDEYGWPAWDGFVRQALDTGSSDPDAMGNVLNAMLGGAGYIDIHEARPGEVAMVNQRAATPGVTAGMCGGSWATACAFIGDSLPSNTFYNAASMSTWGYFGSAPVIRHETKHHLDWSCDQYVGGCPPTASQPVQCTSNPDTLQDCGGAARTVKQFDFENFLGAYTPDHPSQTSATLEASGWVTVKWNHDRKDGGYASPFKTNSITGVDVAFAFSTGPGAPWEWVGRLGCDERFGFCYGSEASGERGFDPYWAARFHCVAVRIEAPTVRLVAQSSQLGLNGSPPAGYWAPAGCW